MSNSPAKLKLALIIARSRRGSSLPGKRRPPRPFRRRFPFIHPRAVTSTKRLRRFFISVLEVLFFSRGRATNIHKVVFFYLISVEFSLRLKTIYLHKQLSQINSPISKFATKLNIFTYLLGARNFFLLRRYKKMKSVLVTRKSRVRRFYKLAAFVR